MRNQHGRNDFRIHHLVLSKTGMYVLETKEWTGINSWLNERKC